MCLRKRDQMKRRLRNRMKRKLKAQAPIKRLNIKHLSFSPSLGLQRGNLEYPSKSFIGYA